MLELEAVRKLVPKNHRNSITQEFLDKLEASANNSAIAEVFKENFLSYMNVLADGRFKMADYINAVKFVSYKLLGYTNHDAYIATFPERYKRYVDDGIVNVYSFASNYNKSKLVSLIFEQTLVPTYVLNAPLHQEALNVLAKMLTDNELRGMAKVKACEVILNHTKQPDVVKAKLEIGVQRSDELDSLREVTEKLAETYQDLLQQGKLNAKEVAEARIIEVEPDDE